jgi:leukotriene-A4 hydrolase
MRLCVIFVLASLVAAITCVSTCSQDKSSFFNCDELTLRHIHMNLTVDFAAQEIRGYVNVFFTPKQQTRQVVLDTRHLRIQRAWLLNERGALQQELQYNLSHPEGSIPVLGDALTMQLPSPATQDFAVRVYFTATNQSEAIQFLQPEQTAGKKYPYLFTQNEAIHARSMIPCPDTPVAKATFSASVYVPSPLVALMSAKRISNSSSATQNIFDYEQQIPVPTYLIALAVGKLESAVIGPRSKVWTEREMLNQAVYEFAETESFIAAAEQFLPKYSWGVYDLLLLPPSFPFGGMENPMLTFVTPTLLAGDRSLANVIAHEIAHSWSGNLVTNRNWEHFWLNEGFTVFTERRIIARTKSEQEAELHSLIGLNELRNNIEEYNTTGHMELTKMIPELNNVDPDDAFSSVPYEKGYNFLYYLSKLVGMDKFERFLNVYFTTFAYKTLTSQEMKSFFLSYFQDKVPSSVLAEIDWDGWFYNEGMPLKENPFDTTLADAAVELANLWLIDPQQAQVCYLLSSTKVSLDSPRIFHLELSTTRLLLGHSDC